MAEELTLNQRMSRLENALDRLCNELRRNRVKGKKRSNTIAKKALARAKPREPNPEARRIAEYWLNKAG